MSSEHVTLTETINALRRIGEKGEPVTTGELISELDCRQETVVTKLGKLAERGEVESKTVGEHGRVWWFPTTTDADDTAQFRSLVDAVEEYAIFMLDPDGNVVTWNAGAKEIKGYESEDIIGKHFSTFYTDEDIRAEIPERNITTAIEEGRVEDEGWRVRKDGSEFWANVVITPIRSDDGELEGFTKVTRDMTERREREQKLRAERDMTEQIVENVPVSITVLSPEGVLLRANSRAFDRLGIDESDVGTELTTPWDVYDSDSDPIPLEELPFTQVVETGERVTDFRCQVDLPSRGRRWFSINSIPIKESGDEIEQIIFTVDDITERRERMRQLRRERNQTEQLLKTSPIAISVQDADGRTLLANERAQELLGLSEREIIERPENIDEWMVYDADGNPLDDSETPTARVLATGEPVLDEEIAIEKPDGERMWISVNAVPIFGHDDTIERVITAGEDITELKTRESQLKRRKSELETELSEILGRVSDAFYALDDDWRFTHINKRAEDIVPYSEESILGKRIWEVLPDADETNLWEEFHEAMETQEPTNFEHYYERHDIWVEINVYPSKTGLSVYSHDITERKDRERRLEQFASIVSHDLRNPLSIAQMYLTALKESNDPEDFAEVKRAHDRMERIIHNLLMMAKKGETTVEPETVSVSDIGERAWKHVKTADATLEFDASIPPMLADEDRLYTVFENLFRNAVKHGGTETTVRVGSLADGFYVEDDGPGIPAGERDEVFEYGYSSNGGTGFGLTIVEEVVEAHGWEITATESKSGGARFEIRGVVESNTSINC